MISRYNCGEGWKSLVDTFCHFAEKIKKDIKINVKEKFGLLRIDFDTSHDAEMTDTERGKLMTVMLVCEHLSQYICEHCGCPGRHRWESGWGFTVCDDCYEGDET